MIDENRKCKDYLDCPEMLVKYVAEKLSIPFGSRKIWAGMTYYAQFIPEPKSVFIDRINSFIYAPFSNKFVIIYPSYTSACDNVTIKEVINQIIGSIAEYQQYMKQKRIDAIITAASQYEL